MTDVSFPYATHHTQYGKLSTFLLIVELLTYIQTTQKSKQIKSAWLCWCGYQEIPKNSKYKYASDVT